MRTSDGRYVPVATAARILGVDEGTILRWIKAGHLPAVRTPGGRYRIVREDIHLAMRPARKPGQS